MPSVGTRQSPRVLSARVLRSGRRILMESHGRSKKTREANVKNKWIEILDNSEEEGRHVIDLSQNPSPENTNDSVVCYVEEHNTKGSAQEGAAEENDIDKRWGIVYRRKRKRTESVVNVGTDDTGFGINVRNRQRKRKHEVAGGLDISSDITAYHSDVVTPSDGTVKRRNFQQHSIPMKKYALRNVESRNSHSIQKRHDFLRKKKAGLRARKAGDLRSELVKIRRRAGHLSAVASTRVLRSSVNKSSTSNIKERSSPIGILTHDASCCMANLLITEADKCYRELGATIALEFLDSSRWVLVVTKNGEKRYNLMAEKTMRPSRLNPFNRSTIWMVDCNWKLEFPDKLDWVSFKELYKKCFDRNMQEPEANDVPVPGVREVANSFNTGYVRYVRPKTYITVKDNELTRALAKKSSIYDMDSDDAEWLAKLNDGLHEVITPERFELAVDSLEKGYYCYPIEEANSASCVHSDRMEVIDAIHSYWMAKRKQNHSTLVRIFQLYQHKRGPVIPEHVLRKKRSFKRQGSCSIGRGKQLTFLQDMAVDRQISSEQRDNKEKLQQANTDAERSERLAVLKRERAQRLMENVNLATYKALMALKLAEEAESSNK